MAKSLRLLEIGHIELMNTKMTANEARKIGQKRKMSPASTNSCFAKFVKQTGKLVLSLAQILIGKMNLNFRSL